MINLAVINKKDLIKYVLKFTVFILIIILSSNILLGTKEKLTFNFINEKEVTAFLDETIPGISQLNTKEEKEKLYDNMNPLELALKMQISALDTIIKKTINDEELGDGQAVASSVTIENEEKIEQAKTRIKYRSSTK